jgi:hypothetical protein
MQRPGTQKENLGDGTALGVDKYSHLAESSDAKESAQVALVGNCVALVICHDALSTGQSVQDHEDEDDDGGDVVADDPQSRQWVVSVNLYVSRDTRELEKR